MTSKNYLLKHRLRLFDAVVNPTKCHALGTWSPTKEHEKNDTVDATQNAPTHHSNETKIQKDRETKRRDQRRKRDTKDLSSTGDESEDGQSSNTHNDQDSDVSFENDTEEEIDTTEIEEEDWIEYIKRSIDEAMEKMGYAKIRCWNETHKK